MEYKCWYDYEKPLRDCVCEVNYVLNPNISDCDCDKDCETGEYLNEICKNSY